jgi:uncharacterized membrane protein YfcA
LTPWQSVAVFAAGIAAGTINTVVGSGTLITFPVLLSVGLPPVSANVSNTVGLVPGSATGAWGYRRELEGQGRRALRLGIATTCGAVVGAVLLLTLPAGAFKAIVPVLIVIALLLVVLGPRLTAKIELARMDERGEIGPALVVLVFLTGVYGGYFGAAQGVLLMGIFGLLLAESLQRQNALKNVLAGLANLVAAVIFVFTGHLYWSAAGLIAAGSILGALIGARVGRRLSPPVLRAVIVAVGIVAIVKLLA